MSANWTFLSHHSHVLIALSDNPERTMDDLARITGLTTRSVANILSDLEESGYLMKKKLGRRNQYTIKLDSALRHETSANRTIGDLIAALGKLDH